MLVAAYVVARWKYVFPCPALRDQVAVLIAADSKSRKCRAAMHSHQEVADSFETFVAGAPDQDVDDQADKGFSKLVRPHDSDH